MFESIQQISDEHGFREKAPSTLKEWEEVRHHLFILLEAPNRLAMEGRMVAQQGEKSENPQVENQPEAIQKLLDADRPAFIRRARRLQDRGVLKPSRSADERRTIGVEQLLNRFRLILHLGILGFLPLLCDHAALHRQPIRRF